MTNQFDGCPRSGRVRLLVAACIAFFVLSTCFLIGSNFSQALADESDSGVYAFICQKGDDTIFVLKNGTDAPDEETYGAVIHSYAEEISDNSTATYNQGWPWMTDTSGTLDEWTSVVTKVAVEGEVSLKWTAGIFANFSTCQEFDLVNLDTTNLTSGSAAYNNMFRKVYNKTTNYDVVIRVGEKWTIPQINTSASKLYLSDGTSVSVTKIPEGAGTYYTLDPAYRGYEIALDSTSFVFNGEKQPSSSSISVVKKDDTSSVLSSDGYQLTYYEATKTIDSNGQESWTLGNTTGNYISAGGYAVVAYMSGTTTPFTSYAYYEITPECALSAYSDAGLSNSLPSTLSVADPYSFYVVCPSALEAMDVVAKSSNMAIATVSSEWFSFDQSNHSVYKVTVTPVASGATTISFWGDTFKGSTGSTYNYIGTDITAISTTVTVRSAAALTPATDAPSSFDLKVGDSPATVAVSYAGDAAMTPSDFSVSSSDDAVATGSYDSSTGTLTVTPHAASDEEATITLKAAQTDTYTSAEYSIKVKVSKSAATLTAGKASLSLVAGGSEDVSVSCTSDGAVTATSSDPSVATATLSQDGKTLSVGALKAGTATVTLQAAATDAYEAPEPVTVAVTVTEKPAATLTAGKASLSLVAGGSEDVSVSCTSDGAVTATSSDPSVATATLSQDGKTLSVGALKAGTATVTLQAAATDAYEAPEPVTVAVTVTEKPNGSIDVDATLALTVGDEPRTVSLDYTGDGTLSIENTNNSVATVSLSGTLLTVTPVAAGTTTVTISAGEGAEYGSADPVTIVVTVKDAKEIITKDLGSLTVGASVDILISLDFDGTVSVQSSDTKIATAKLSDDGTLLTVTPVAPGTATITLSSDGAEKDLALTVTVNAASQKAEVKLVDDGKTGVTIGTDTIDLADATSDDDVKMVVEALTSGDDYDTLVAKKGDGEFVGVYAITLSVNGEGVHSDFGSVTLTFPVDASYNGQQATVWHLHEDGSITSETATVTDGKVTITVTDLSTFAVEVAKADTTGDVTTTTGNATQTSGGSGLTQTGDAVSPVVASTAVAATVAAVACVASRRRGKKAELAAEAPHGSVS